MNGIPIGGPGTNEWYQKQEKQRNFIFGNISEKLLTGEDINEEDISKSSYLESVVGGLIDATIKTPFVFNYIGAAIIDYFGEEGIPVEQSEVAKLTKAIESIPILGDIDKVSKEAAEATLPGQIAHIIGEVVGANKIAGAMKVGQLVTDYALSGRLMLGGGKNVVEASKVATELNKVSGAQRFFAIAAGDAAEGVLTNALIVDAGTWETLGNFSFIGGPTAADTIERKTSKEEAERLLLNRLKFGVEGGVLGGAIGAIRGGYRVLFSSGDSEIYKEAAKQIQNSIKTESKLEEMATKYGKEDLIPEEFIATGAEAEATTGTTLYSGLPVDKITNTIIENAAKAKQSVAEYLESKGGAANLIDKRVLSLLRSRGRLPEDVFNKYYYAEKTAASAEMHGGSAYAELQGTLNETFKERSLLNKTSSNEILRETNDLLLNTKNEIVTLPDGSVQLEFKGFKDIKTAPELTEVQKNSIIERAKYFREREAEAIHWMDKTKFAKQAEELEVAAYKNKKVEDLTTKDKWDYHKFKHPNDVPTRFAEYPGDHWVDTCTPGIGADIADTGIDLFNSQALANIVLVIPNPAYPAVPPNPAVPQYIDSGSPIPLNLSDFSTSPTKVLRGQPLNTPVASHYSRISTEIKSIALTGSGPGGTYTLRAGSEQIAGGATQITGPSYGAIIEKTGGSPSTKVDLTAIPPVLNDVTGGVVAGNLAPADSNSEHSSSIYKSISC